MNDRTRKSSDASRHDKRSKRRAELVAPLSVAGMLVIYGVTAYRDHAQGEDWMSALGLVPDWGYFRFFGDFGVPIMVTVVLLHTVRKLPSSREKRILTWLAWSFFVFLFVWAFVVMMVFGSS